jgi:hypothetical protein
MFETIGVDSVVDRLTSEVVSTRAVEPEPTAGSAPEEALKLNTSVPAGRYLAVNWSGVEVNITDVRHLLGRRPGCEVMELLSAGGAAALEADALIVKRIALQPREVGVLVLVKAWEPPMLEFLDFMKELRTGTDCERRLVVVLLGLSRDGRIGAPSAGDVTLWRRQLGTLEDDRLTVATWEEEGI